MTDEKFDKLAPKLDNDALVKLVQRAHERYILRAAEHLMSRGSRPNYQRGIATADFRLAGDLFKKTGHILEAAKAYLEGDDPHGAWSLAKANEEERAEILRMAMDAANRGRLDYFAPIQIYMLTNPKILWERDYLPLLSRMNETHVVGAGSFFAEALINTGVVPKSLPHALALLKIDRARAVKILDNPSFLSPRLWAPWSGRERESQAELAADIAEFNRYLTSMRSRRTTR